MIKIFKNILFSLAVMATVVSCNEEDGRITFEGPYYTSFTSSSATIGEAGFFTDIKVGLSTPTLNTDVTVNYTFGGTAIEGEDFEVVGGGSGSLVIPAGSNIGTIRIKAIDDVVSGGNLNLSISLVSNSAGLAVGRGEVGKSFSLTITDDDCPLAEGFAGTYNVDEVFTSGVNEGLTLANAFGESYQVELAVDPSDVSGTSFIITNSAGFNTFIADGTVVKFLTCSGELDFGGALNLALFADLNITASAYNEGAFSLQASGTLGTFGPFEFVLTKK